MYPRIETLKVCDKRGYNRFEAEVFKDAKKAEAFAKKLKKCGVFFFKDDTLIGTEDYIIYDVEDGVKSHMGFSKYARGGVQILVVNNVNEAPYIKAKVRASVNGDGNIGVRIVTSGTHVVTANITKHGVRNHGDLAKEYIEVIDRFVERIESKNFKVGDSITYLEYNRPVGVKMQNWAVARYFKKGVEKQHVESLRLRSQSNAPIPPMI